LASGITGEIGQSSAPKLDLIEQAQLRGSLARLFDHPRGDIEMSDMDAPSRQAQREASCAGAGVKRGLDAFKTGLDLTIDVSLVNDVVEE
jgi:hypothetical protein